MIFEKGEISSNFRKTLSKPFYEKSDKSEKQTTWYDDTFKTLKLLVSDWMRSYVVLRSIPI